MKKVHVATGDKSFDFVLRQEGNRLFISSNGKEHAVDLVRMGNGRYSLLIGGRSFEIGARLTGDGYVLSNGSHSGTFTVEDAEIARIKRAAGIDEATVIKKLSAPMPGLIVSVDCEEGQEVEHNQPIVVMEAMKMENVIKAPAAGKIKSIAVTPGTSVEKGQLILEFE
jgi:biotin carboxyl carrier protein